LSMLGGSGARIQMMQHQADALVSMSGGTPPVSGTKYEWSTDGSVANALGSQKNVNLLAIGVAVTWTVQPTPLEVHITIDGQAYTASFANPVSATYYRVFIPVSGILELTNQTPTHSGAFSLLKGRSVKVEAETTGGTVSALNMLVKWARIP